MNVVHLIMQKQIKTSFGKQENREIIINEISLTDVSAEEEHLAIEQGFLIDVLDDEYWFMSRSTRVITSSVDAKEYNGKWELVETLTPNLNKILRKILNQYVQKHNFKDFERSLNETKRTKFFIYYHNSRIVAFTKMQFYPEIDQSVEHPPKGVETCMFAWDYKNPELRLGELTLQHEVYWAQQEGFKYLYIGPGYEKSSIYKSNIAGFEWWTGMEGSKDTHEYKELCKRDSKIRSFKALTSLD